MRGGAHACTVPCGQREALPARLPAHLGHLRLRNRSQLCTRDVVGCEVVLVSCEDYARAATTSLHLVKLYNAPTEDESPRDICDW